MLVEPSEKYVAKSGKLTSPSTVPLFAALSLNIALPPTELSLWVLSLNIASPDIALLLYELESTEFSGYLTRYSFGLPNA